jgi:hypothetical protein
VSALLPPATSRRHAWWHSHSWLCAVLFFSAFLALPASAGTLSGTVVNATTGKPVPHADVILISLQGTMQPVETIKSDAEGHFQFNRPEIGQGPMLIRVPYENVNYHQPAPPGRDSVTVNVYEANAPASAPQLTSRTIIYQPNGTRMLVGEEFVIDNSAKPPATYANTKGTFEFEIPDGAQLGQVSAAGPGGMPVTQGTIDKAKNRYAVDFPLKPGESNIRVSYEMPYDGNKATIRAASAVPVARVMLAVPTGVQVSADGFAPAGTDQGFTLMTRENVAPGTAFNVALSGAATAPPPGAGGGGGGGQQPAGRDAGAAPEAVQVLSPRLSSFQWIILGGMGLFFLAGFFFLMRQQRAMPVTPDGAYAPAPVTLPPAAKLPRRAEAVDLGNRPVPASMEEADRGVKMGLDELKDTLFRLELRHQAGTIADEDYARERARLEAVLRGYVRG